jgi:hypothetical protein
MRKQVVTLDPAKAMDFLSDLPYIGANPFRQVISGGGLCLSDGAILDLPPYSNMRLNVMWIDDHLKYALHDELGHFNIHIFEVGSARENNAGFYQSRHLFQPSLWDVRWHMRTYLMRLLLGCVADAWLRSAPCLKWSLPFEAPFVPSDWRNGRAWLDERTPHAYAKSFLQILPRRLTTAEATKLKDQLWSIGRRRLFAVAQHWGGSSLRYDKKWACQIGKTCASYEDSSCEDLKSLRGTLNADHFAHGTFLELFVKGITKDMWHDNAKRAEALQCYLPENWKGLEREVADLPPEKCPTDDLTNVNLDALSLAQSLQVLVEDFVKYFEAVVFWRYVAYSVRSLVNRSGHDPRLNWLFPPDETYEEQGRYESAVHGLSQLMDIALDEKDAGKSTGIQIVDSFQDPLDPRGPIFERFGTWDRNQRTVTVYKKAMKDYARREQRNGRECPCDLLYLVVVYHALAHIIAQIGHGHGAVGWRDDGSASKEERERFALAFTHQFLAREGKDAALKLMEKLTAEEPAYKRLRWQELSDPTKLREKLWAARWPTRMTNRPQDKKGSKKQPAERPRTHKEN